MRSFEYVTSIKKWLPLILAIVLILLFSFSFVLQGSKYYYQYWSFRIVFPAQQLVETGIFESPFLALNNASFFPLETEINNSLNVLPANIFFLTMLSTLTRFSPIVLLQFGLYSIFFTITCIFFYLFIREKQNSVILFFLIVLSFFLNPILSSVLQISSGLIFVGISFSIWILLKALNRVKEYSVVKVFSILILFILFTFYFYYTAFYFIILLVMCFLVVHSSTLIFEKFYFGKSQVKISGNNMPLTHILTITIIVLTALCLLIISGYGPLKAVSTQLNKFFDIPTLFARFINYYLGEKLSLLEVSSDKTNIAYSQPPSYTFPLLAYLFFLLIPILVFLIKKINSFFKASLTNKERTVLSLCLLLLVLIPLSISANSLDRLPWLLSFVSLICIFSFYNEEKKTFLLALIGYLLVSLFVYIPLTTNVTTTNYVYSDSDIKEYNKIIDLTTNSSKIWSDLKTSSYLINSNRIPVALYEGPYLGDVRYPQTYDLYQNMSNVIKLLKKNMITNIYVSKPMKSPTGFIYSYNFYLKPLPDESLNYLNNTETMDKIFSGAGDFYKIN